MNYRLFRQAPASEQADRDISSVKHNNLLVYAKLHHFYIRRTELKQN